MGNGITASESAFLKTLVAVRDPRDVAISRYTFGVCSGDYPELNEQNIEFFDKDACGTIGGWSSFYEGCFALYQKNIKFVKFEERVEDPCKIAKEILSFLELDFSESEIKRAIESASFENSKKSEQNIMNNHKHLVVDNRGMYQLHQEYYLFQF